MIDVNNPMVEYVMQVSGAYNNYMHHYVLYKIFYFPYNSYILMNDMC